MATIIVMGTIGNNPTNLAEVLEAWRTNKTFLTPHEMTSYMSKHDFEKYGNKLDGVTFKAKDLSIELEKGIL